MKKALSLFFRFLSTSLFTFLLSLGTVYVTVTGLKIEEDFYFLLFAAVVFSVLTAIPYVFKKAWPLQIVLLLIFGFLSYKYYARIQEGLMLLIARVSEVYHFTFHGIPEVTFPDILTETSVTTWFFAFAIMLFSWTGAACINRELSFICIVSLTLPFVLVCMIPLNTTPHYLPLCITAFSYLYLAFSSSSVFQKGRFAGYRLLLILPAAFLIALFAFLTHPENYVKPNWTKTAQGFYSRATSGIPGFGSFGESETLGDEPWNDSRSHINLRNVGPMEKSLNHVMDVTSDTRGLLYLKGTSFSDYLIHGWENKDTHPYAPGTEVWVNSEGTSSREFTVITDHMSEILYTGRTLKELPKGAVCDRDHSLLNRRRIRKYTEFLTEEPEILTEEYIQYVKDTYTSLPESTLYGIDPLLASELSIGSVFNIEDLSAKIVSYLSSCNVYSLDTPAMPEDEDFVLWFLTKAPSGYCIHFASAATVLFRYFGIPARLCTGYLIQDTVPGEETPVYQYQAHAWVEYFNESSGWITLEVTPGAEGDSQSSPQGQDVSPSQETYPWEKETREGFTREERETDSPSLSPDDSSDDKKSSQRADDENTHRLPSYVILLILVLPVLLWFWIRTLIRVWLTGNSDNKAALSLYRRLRFISRITHVEIPKKAEELALKARFSNQNLSGHEMNELRKEYYYYTERLKLGPPRIKGILYRIIFFI